MVRLEVLWSARNAEDMARKRLDLDALDNLPVEAEHWEAAEDAMQRLSEISRPREVTFPDLLIAAVAETNGIAVLHYDKDYDLLRERDIFNIKTEWAAERGTVDVPTPPQTSEPEQRS